MTSKPPPPQPLGALWEFCPAGAFLAPPLEFQFMAQELLGVRAWGRGSAPTTPPRPRTAYSCDPCHPQIPAAPPTCGSTWNPSTRPRLTCFLLLTLVARARALLLPGPTSRDGISSGNRESKPIFPDSLLDPEPAVHSDHGRQALGALPLPTLVLAMLRTLESAPAPLASGAPVPPLSCCGPSRPPCALRFRHWQTYTLFHHLVST